VFAIVCGVMPIFLATVVPDVINAGLTARLERQALTDEPTGVMTRRRRWPTHGRPAPRSPC
jgi:hypothetical protein